MLKRQVGQSDSKGMAREIEIVGCVRNLSSGITKYGGPRHISFDLFNWADEDGVVHEESKHFEMLLAHDDPRFETWESAIVRDAFVMLRSDPEKFSSIDFSVESETPEDPRLTPFQELITDPSELSHWLWKPPTATVTGSKEQRDDFHRMVRSKKIQGFTRSRLKSDPNRHVFAEGGARESHMHVRDVGDQIRVAHRLESTRRVGRSDQTTLMHFVHAVEDHARDAGVDIELDPAAEPVPDLYRVEPFVIEDVGECVPEYRKHAKRFIYDTHRTELFDLPFAMTRRCFGIAPTLSPNLAAISINRIVRIVHDSTIKRICWTDFQSTYDELGVELEEMMNENLPASEGQIGRFVTPWHPSVTSSFEVLWPMSCDWDPEHGLTLKFDKNGQISKSN